MKKDPSYLPRRTSGAAGVMSATFAACALVLGAEGSFVATMAAACAAAFFLSLALVAASRTPGARERDTLPGMAAPAIGYATAFPVSVAVPLAVFDMTTASIGPVAVPFSVLAAMSAVAAIMLAARAVDLRIDRPARAADQPAREAPEPQDMP